MPIIIEEVTGVVEPESTPSAQPDPGSAEASRSPPDPAALRAEMHRMAGRIARLRAD